MAARATGAGALRTANARRPFTSTEATMKSRCLLWAAAAAAALLVCLPSEVRASSSIGWTRISLPKGPGSIHGLGRNFEPSLASGTASYGVNIAMPPGAGGFGPSLSLEYDSGGGVSDLG